MKEPCGEGPASQTDPESCAGSCEGTVEGEYVGELLSCEMLPRMPLMGVLKWGDFGGDSIWKTWKIRVN